MTGLFQSTLDRARLEELIEKEGSGHLGALALIREIFDAGSGNRRTRLGAVMELGNITHGTVKNVFVAKEGTPQRRTLLAICKAFSLSQEDRGYLLTRNMGVPFLGAPVDVSRGLDRLMEEYDGDDFAAATHLLRAMFAVSSIYNPSGVKFAYSGGSGSSVLAPGFTGKFRSSRELFSLASALDLSVGDRVHLHSFLRGYNVENVRAALRGYRTDKNISLKSIGERVGWKKRMVQNVLNSSPTDPSKESWVKLCNGLEVSPADRAVVLCAVAGIPYYDIRTPEKFKEHVEFYVKKEGSPVAGVRAFFDMLYTSSVFTNPRDMAGRDITERQIRNLFDPTRPLPEEKVLVAVAESLEVSPENRECLVDVAYNPSAYFTLLVKTRVGDGASPWEAVNTGFRTLYDLEGRAASRLSGAVGWGRSQLTNKLTDDVATARKRTAVFGLCGAFGLDEEAREYVFRLTNDIPDYNPSNEEEFTARFGTLMEENDNNAHVAVGRILLEAFYLSSFESKEFLHKGTPLSRAECNGAFNQSGHRLPSEYKFGRFCEHLGITGKRKKILTNALYKDK